MEEKRTSRAGPIEESRRRAEENWGAYYTVIIGRFGN